MLRTMPFSGFLLLLGLLLISPAALAQTAAEPPKRRLVCGSCQKTFENGRFCSFDGARLHDLSIERPCPRCDRAFAGAIFCPEDGASLLLTKSEFEAQEARLAEEEELFAEAEAETRSEPLGPAKIAMAVVFLVVVCFVAYRLIGAPSSEFLCDRCAYNDGRYCSKPERPNARVCSDFKRR